MARTPISKKTRFEVFKRDQFTCQYCGASAPEVILEIDHIKPVSKGGTNDILNLVTSCRNCNRGKSKNELSDNSVVKLQKKQLDDMQIRKEQREMLVEWKEFLSRELDEEVNCIEEFFLNETGYQFTKSGSRKIRDIISRFGFSEAYDSCSISINKYFKGSKDSASYAFEKIGGVCYNRQKARKEDA